MTGNCLPIQAKESKPPGSEAAESDGSSNGPVLGEAVARSDEGESAQKVAPKPKKRNRKRQGAAVSLPCYYK